MGLKKEIKDIYERTPRSDRNDLVTTWTEEEYWKGETKEVFSVIFRTRGCSWTHTSGCSMCGYYTDTNPDIDLEDIEEQLDEASDQYKDEEIVKIYTSGSFFDPKEIPKDLALNILKSFDASKLVIESRPEFIDKDRIKRYAQGLTELEVAIGLESANDFILDKCINKGFKYEDYRKSVTEISNHVSIRTYLLLKPPFLHEKEAIEDIIRATEKISDLTDIISINPVNIQNGSLVERLWHRDLYRPPWLWSIIEILSKIESDQTVFISNAGLGSERGAHNCGECDERILDWISTYNKTQDKKTINSFYEDYCDCFEKWKREIDIEPFLFYRGSPKLLSDRYTGYI